MEKVYNLDFLPSQKQDLFFEFKQVVKLNVFKLLQRNIDIASFSVAMVGTKDSATTATSAPGYPLLNTA